MASPNYSYAKRQRELAKKQKKEAKLARKAEKAANSDDELPPDEGADAGADEAPEPEGDTA